MNRLVIIGNGFDMAHGLKTSYMDFINWYWNQRVNTFVGNTTKVSEDMVEELMPGFEYYHTVNYLRIEFISNYIIEY